MMENIMQFSEGEIIGKVSEFKTESQFVKSVKEELSIDFGTQDPEVDRNYVRWYPKSPEGLSNEFPDGCYTFCKPGRGAFEVFVIGG